MSRRLRLWSLVLVLLASPASGFGFEFEDFGFAVPSDCNNGIPFPACAVIDVFASTANDLPDTIPGNWTFSEHGQVLFGQGAGMFLFDDPGPTNNDFFGTWTNVLSPPDGNGVSTSVFHYTVTGGSGMFAGLAGAGESDLTVVTAPVLGTSDVFVAACGAVAPGLGGFCERGAFVIPVPPTIALSVAGLALLAGAVARGRRPRRRLARGR